MKIVVLMGSPNKKGSTSILVDNFLKGTYDAGHSCEVIDVFRHSAVLLRNEHPAKDNC